MEPGSTLKPGRGAMETGHLEKNFKWKIYLKTRAYPEGSGPPPKKFETQREHGHA